MCPPIYPPPSPRPVKVTSPEDDLCIKWISSILRIAGPVIGGIYAVWSTYLMIRVVAHLLSFHDRVISDPLTAIMVSVVVVVFWAVLLCLVGFLSRLSAPVVFLARLAALVVKGDRNG